jgi:hypothetical protein
MFRVAWPISVASEARKSGVSGLMGSVLMFPLAVVKSGLDLMNTSALVLARATQPATAPPPVPSPSGTTPAQAVIGTAPKEVSLQGIQSDSNGVSVAQNTKREQKRMADMDLSDDQAKLVRWKVLSLDRFQGETVLGQGEEVVTDNLTAIDYTVRVTATFMENHTINRGQLKNLRVWFDVLARFEREKLEYETRTLDRLAGIERNLAAIGDKIAP